MSEPIRLERRAKCGLCGQNFDASAQHERAINVLRELVRTRYVAEYISATKTEHDKAWADAVLLLATLTPGGGP